MLNLPDVTTPEGRKGAALLALLGGAMVFTVFAAVGVYLVRHSPGLSFWLAICAHGQVFVVLAAFAWVLGVRRTVKVDRDGLELDDKGTSE